MENYGKQDGDGSTSSRKKKRNDLHSFIKIPVQGRKVLKLEIYNADDIKCDEMFCKCNAEICCQHVVKNIFKDEIYSLARELIEKMCENLPSENKDY